MEISEVISFFEEKGDMHDCIVTEISFYEGRFDIKVDDINKNFVGFKGYYGPIPAIVRCICEKRPVIEMRMLDQSNAGWIADCKLREFNGNIDIEFRFSNGGYIKLLCENIDVLCE